MYFRICSGEYESLRNLHLNSAHIWVISNQCDRDEKKEYNSFKYKRKFQLNFAGELNISFREIRR